MNAHSAEKDAGSGENPYDVEDTCQCSAWSASECACDGYVDRAQVRAWDEGYRAGYAKALSKPEIDAVRANALREAADEEDWRGVMFNRDGLDLTPENRVRHRLRERADRTRVPPPVEGRDS